MHRGVVLLFAVAAGTAVATIYFAQPLLVTMGAELGIAASTVGAIVTLTQLGYGLGLFLLVPLGDLLDRRRLVVGQLTALAVAELVAATASNGAVLLAGMAAIGVLAVVTQILVAFAASLAAPAGRGRVVGLVTTGVVLGILLARTVSGALADVAGWRAVYLSSAGVTVLIAIVLYRVLPASVPARERLRYGRLLRSTVSLFVREPVFRLRGTLALLIFAAFGTLWSSVALPLTEDGYSHTVIGAFGLAGAAGALAAAPAGRLADRGRAQWTTGTALGLLLMSWVPLGFTRGSLWALAAGAILLDFAVQAVHVTSQTLIYPLRPDAGSRLIGGYMIFYSVGSGLGAIGSTIVYAFAGWTGVCLLGAGFSALALGVWGIRAAR
ncbi:MFS transporter [Amycolatopsis regifaucium]|uniref:Transporter n=1 Tax=Amycolatopsis regifaucium TaxID=546365 RepID=A0A154MKM5_9PSEU|nr:MFS transporter [Amycolatopsis regifaucium]KZB84437.1 transporter [Amycolatopsis regifaucium]OKA10900.1 MFS transporter [Amycolatopsis regifaucium]SFI21375.1 Predicted arabinose efflux permease, MFS family [Amycolatopsis regifaucium]